MIIDYIVMGILVILVSYCAIVAQYFKIKNIKLLNKIKTTAMKTTCNDTKNYLLDLLSNELKLL